MCGQELVPSLRLGIPTSEALPQLQYEAEPRNLYS